MSEIGEQIRNQLLGALSQREQIEHKIAESSRGDFETRMQLFAKLENWRRDLEEALKYCKAEVEKLSPLLMEEMAENGIENMRVDGLSIFTTSRFYCSKKSNADGVTTDQVCDVLRRLGMGEIVSEGYAAASLKSKVKEWLDSGVQVPAELDSLIQYGEMNVLTSRK